MSNEDIVSQVLVSLVELQNDNTIPKNVKSKIESIIFTLNETNEMSIKVNKALDGFDDIVNDSNLEPHTRSQLWWAMSALGSCESNK